MFCHVSGSCSGPLRRLRRSFARRRMSFRSPVCGASPEVRERPCSARLARAQARARRWRERWGCHELSWSGVRFGRFRRSGAFVHEASRLLSINCPGCFPEPRLKAGTGPESVPVSRVSRARRRAGAGGRFAPARFTRLIARASRRAHLPRRPAPGSFSRSPAIASLRRKAERRPRKPPLSIVIIHPVRPESSPLRGLNSRYVPHRAKGTCFRAGQVDAALGFFSASGSNPITQNSGICARISHPWPERFREKSFSTFPRG